MQFVPVNRRLVVCSSIVIIASDVSKWGLSSSVGLYHVEKRTSFLSFLFLFELQETKSLISSSFTKSVF